MTAERALRDRIDELEEENRQLKEMLRPNLVFPKALGLSPTLEAIAAMLLARAPNLVPHESLLVQIWGEGGEKRTLEVHVCKLRKILLKHGISIERIWGRGYRLNAENAERLRAAIGGAL